MSLVRGTACAKAGTPAEYNDLEEAVVLVPQLPHTVLKDTSRNSIEFLGWYSFLFYVPTFPGQVQGLQLSSGDFHTPLPAHLFCLLLLSVLRVTYQWHSKAHLFPAFSVPLALPFLRPEEMPFPPLLHGEVHLSFKT